MEIVEIRIVKKIFLIFTDVSVFNHILISLLMFAILLPFTKTPMLKARFHELYIKEDYSPCCSFPCQNRGVCVEITSGSYACNCTHTGYYGRNCEKQNWTKKMRRKMFFVLKMIFYNDFIALIINSFDWIHTVFYLVFIPAIVDQVEQSNIPLEKSDYMGMTNSCIKFRLMPPIPIRCPTPLGTEGLSEFPLLNKSYMEVFRRRTFRRNKKSINLLFAIFGQHLTLQFSECDSRNWMKCSQIYSLCKRSYINGKLETHISKGEQYPVLQRNDFGWIARGNAANIKYLTTENTLTMSLTTVLLREHNRICNILVNIYPMWDDDTMFTVAKNIVTGELLVITSEWLALFSDFKFDVHYKPLMLTASKQNRIPIEIYFAFHWPQMFPEILNLDNKKLNMYDLLQSLDPNEIYKHGIYNLIKSLATTHAGQVMAENIGESMLGTTKMLIRKGRKFMLPSINQYRSFLGLQQYQSFLELTQLPSLNVQLQKMYGSVNGVEFVSGILLESANNDKVVGETSEKLISNWLLKAITTHPLTKDILQKSDLIGGEVGAYIIKHANLNRLICKNVKEENLCFQEDFMKFQIPNKNYIGDKVSLNKSITEKYHQKNKNERFFFGLLKYQTDN